MGESGITDICLDLLRSRDDDLVLYTLMLLTHLSKLVHHRDDLSRTDLIPVLYEQLTYSYGVIQVPQKRRIFTELCAVMGQMANDDENRVRMNEDFQRPVREMLLLAFDEEQKNTSSISNSPGGSGSLINTPQTSARPDSARRTASKVSQGSSGGFAVSGTELTGSSVKL